MFIVAFIWILFGALAIGVGVEKEETWRKRFNMGAVVDHVRRVLLIVGGIISGVTIIASFYFFVFKNALIIFVSWVVVFLLVRVFIEMLMRRTTIDELPPPIMESPQVSTYDREIGVEGNSGDNEKPLELRDESDAEEVESNMEFAPIVAAERREDDGIRSGWENANEAPNKPVPLSHRDERTVAKPQLEPGDPRGGEYNELFERINKSKK